MSLALLRMPVTSLPPARQAAPTTGSGTDSMVPAVLVTVGVLAAGAWWLWSAPGKSPRSIAAKVPEGALVRIAFHVGDGPEQKLLVRAHGGDLVSRGDRWETVAKGLSKAHSGKPVWISDWWLVKIVG